VLPVSKAGAVPRQAGTRFDPPAGRQPHYTLGPVAPNASIVRLGTGATATCTANSAATSLSTSAAIARATG